MVAPTRQFIKTKARGAMSPSSERPISRLAERLIDANDNVTSITPPGRPAHAFDYTPLDLESQYTPPDVNPGSKIIESEVGKKNHINSAVGEIFRPTSDHFPAQPILGRRLALPGLYVTLMPVALTK